MIPHGILRVSASCTATFPAVRSRPISLSASPGETEQEFSQSVSFLQTCELAAVHVFPYSRRKGTPAASMPDQIEKAEKERRAAVAGETAAALHRAYLARQLGTEHDVLFEQTEKGYFTGHTMNYVKVYCRCGKPPQ